MDLDGVICELRQEGLSYDELRPLPGAAEKLAALRAAGHTIIIQTARHMKTCGGNVGRVIAKQGLTTLRWLERHEIQYDELHFGKPHADIYIDDNAFRFVRWADLCDDGSNLPQSREDAARQAERPA
ncbi:MAG: capsular biosynthesis protein [Acidobacteria bacterium]|nr:capsular biosynthesis protein [Acidobacteriota bacterium]